MKRFFLKILSIVIPLLLLLTIINYIIDPAQIFSNGYEKKLVDIISSGKNVITAPNYNERFFMSLIAKSNIKKPNILVLGSSRTMLLNRGLLKDSSLINASVSSAVLEDYIVYYQMFKDNDKLPEKKIIIGIDPWTFNEFNGETRWEQFSEYLNLFINGSNKKSDNNNVNTKDYQLFSLSYFQSSIELLIKGKVKFTPKATNHKYNTEATILTDISHTYPTNIRNRSKQEVSNKVNEYISNNYYKINNFTHPSDYLFRNFKLLVDDIKDNNIELTLFISPYHPKVYNKVIISHPAIAETELLIRDFALNNNIKIIGSFNPYNLNLDENYFYDGMHCNEKGIVKILESN